MSNLESLLFSCFTCCSTFKSLV